MSPSWPAPARDDKSAPFYTAAAHDALTIRRCRDCATHLPPEAIGCTLCGSGSLQWAPAAGTGHLVTWTTVHRPPNGAYSDLVPYTLGIVELDEGPWLHARITPGDTTLSTGLHLHARFVHTPDAESYPVFDPAPPTESCRPCAQRPSASSPHSA